MRTATSARRVCSAPASASQYTATTRMPRRCAVRVIRQAISPRLAINKVVNIGCARSEIDLEELTSNQHAADFVGARADLIELGIAQQSPRGIVVDVAVAPQCLDGVERATGCIFAGKEDAAGGI